MATLSSSASLLGQQLLFEVFTPITTPQADLCSIHVSRDFLIYKRIYQEVGIDHCDNVGISLGGVGGRRHMYKIMWT